MKGAFYDVLIQRIKVETARSMLVRNDKVEFYFSIHIQIIIFFYSSDIDKYHLLSL